MKIKFDIIVMVQGDEPMTNATMIDEAVSAINEDQKCAGRQPRCTNSFRKTNSTALTLLKSYATLKVTHWHFQGNPSQITPIAKVVCAKSKFA